MRNVGLNIVGGTLAENIHHLSHARHRYCSIGISPKTKPITNGHTCRLSMMKIIKPKVTSNVAPYSLINQINMVLCVLITNVSVPPLTMDQGKKPQLRQKH